MVIAAVVHELAASSSKVYAAAKLLPPVTMNLCSACLTKEIDR